MEKIFSRRNKLIIGSLIIVLPIILGIFGMLINGPDGYNIFTRLVTDSYIDTTIAVIVILGGMLLIDIIMEIILISNKKGYFLASIANLILTIAAIIISINGHLVVVLSVVFLVIALIFELLGVIYYILGFKFDKENLESENENARAAYLPTLIVNIISTLVLVIVFFIPLYSIKTLDEDGVEFTKNLILITGFNNFTDTAGFIVFLIMLGAYIVSVSLTLSCLKYFFHKSIKFSYASKVSVIFNFAISIIFFVAGSTIVFIFGQKDNTTATSISFIPFVIMAIITIAHSFLNARNEYLDNKDKSNRLVPKAKWMILFSVIAFTAVTIVSLFLTLIDVQFDEPIYGTTPDPIKITPMDLIIKATEYGKDFQLASFGVFVVLMVTIILFVLSLACFFSKSGEIKRIGLVSITTNLIFVVAMGLFCKYFNVSLAISLESLKGYIAKNFGEIGASLVSSITSGFYSYKVGGQVFYMLFVDVALAVIVILLKPFTKLEEGTIGDVEVSNSDPLSVEIVDGKTSNVANELGASSNTTGEVIIKTFDACPAFSELDSLIPSFEEKMADRRNHLFEDPTLPSLISFIVQYAKESPKHLSYQPEDIASFIAGLGATKLSILQGMSGTGKTSLPKIFLEALMGNCEIIEVESSWKDKNELLGYYNEFSKTFTPKKFTRALYKAALNKDVVTFIVLDEMNLSRIEYYFSDFLSLMENEPENREIQLLNVKLYNNYDNTKHSYKGLVDDHTIHIPENVWFIGTANRDESTFEISDKVYDRAHTMNFNKRAPKVRNYTSPIDKRFLPYDMFNKLLNDAVINSSFDLESVSYIKKVEELLRPFNISFGNRIMNQIEAYVKIYSQCFPDDKEAESEALETILLSKVIAKLEFKAIEDKETLVRSFEKLNLHKCAEFISRLNEDL